MPVERTLSFPGPVSRPPSPHNGAAPGDPCFQIIDGVIWRTSLQRSGPVTARISRTAADTIHCRAWGEVVKSSSPISRACWEPTTTPVTSPRSTRPSPWRSGRFRICASAAPDGCSKR